MLCEVLNFIKWHPYFVNDIITVRKVTSQIKLVLNFFNLMVYYVISVKDTSLFQNFVVTPFINLIYIKLSQI